MRWFGIQIANIFQPSRGQPSGDSRLYVRPKTLDEALLALAGGPMQVLAGGTDFYPALGDRPAQGAVLDVSSIGELRGISVEPQWVRIGGLTTWTDIIQAPLPRCFDALKSAAR